METPQFCLTQLEVSRACKFLQGRACCRCQAQMLEKVLEDSLPHNALSLRARCMGSSPTWSSSFFHTVTHSVGERYRTQSGGQAEPLAHPAPCTALFQAHATLKARPLLPLETPPTLLDKFAFLRQPFADPPSGGPQPGF